MWKVERSGELKHHGVKGQKWGKRQWQNVDGSLTPAGRIHYGVKSGRYDTEGRLTQKGYDNLERLHSLWSKASENYSRRSFKYASLNKKDTERGRKLAEKIQAAYESDPNKQPIKGSSDRDEGLVELKELSNKYLSEQEAKEFAGLIDKYAEKDAKNKVIIEKYKEKRAKVGEKYSKATTEFISQMVAHDQELNDVIERKKALDKIAQEEWDRISDQSFLDKIGSNKNDPRSYSLRKYKDHYEFDGDGSEFWWKFADEQIQKQVIDIEQETSRALRKSVEKAYSNVMNKKLIDLKDSWHNDFGDDPLTNLFGISFEVIYNHNYGY